MQDGEFVERRAETHGIIIRFELLGVIAALVIQTAAALWSFSAMTVKVEYVQKALTEIKSDMISQMGDRYTNKDAMKDIAAVLDRINTNASRLDRNEARISSLENRCSLNAKP